MRDSKIKALYNPKKHHLDKNKQYPKMKTLQQCSQMEVRITTRMESKEREN